MYATVSAAVRVSAQIRAVCARSSICRKLVSGATGLDSPRSTERRRFRYPARSVFRCACCLSSSSSTAAMLWWEDERLSIAGRGAAAAGFAPAAAEWPSAPPELVEPRSLPKPLRCRAASSPECVADFCRARPDGGRQVSAASDCDDGARVGWGAAAGTERAGCRDPASAGLPASLRVHVFWRIFLVRAGAGTERAGGFDCRSADHHQPAPLYLV